MTARGSDPIDRMAALDQDERAHVRATVVRAQRPTSATPGASAVVLPDGSIEGFVGGQCAESSVCAAALHVLESGEPLLLRILPEDAEPFPDTPGARTVVNPCLSGGAIELFLEARFPPRRLVAVGRTPIAEAVVALATSLGFRAVAEDGVPERLDRTTAVVVAGHGRSEEETIRAALDGGVDYIGLVASARRGRAVLDDLDLSPDEDARVRTPAGLDIGAETPDEIALSIMAEVVRAVRVDGLGASPAADGEATTTESATAVDPICGMTVVAALPTLSLDVDDITHWFCNPGCRDAFAEQNGRAVQPAPGS